MTFSRGRIWAVAGTRPVSASAMTLMCSRIADSWLRNCSRSASESARRASAATWLTVFSSMLINVPLSGQQDVAGKGVHLPAVADGEAGERAVGCAPSLLDAVYGGGEGAAPQSVEVVLQCGASALGDNLDGPIWKVGRVAGEAAPRPFTLGEEPVAHTLHAAVDNRLQPDATLHLLCHRPDSCT